MLFEFSIVLVLFLLLDSVYLYLTKNMFGEMVARIQRVAMQVRLWSAAVVYLLLAIVMYHFVIKKKFQIWEAVLLGLAIYGVFDFTCYAMFKNYDLRIALMDTLWGGVLFGSVAWIYPNLTTFV